MTSRIALPGSHEAVGVVACGALAQDINGISDRRGWSVRVYPLPPLLHNEPARIPEAVTKALQTACGRHQACAVAYADCGTYGGIDAVAKSFGVPRLAGQHCYDVYAGQDTVSGWLRDEPGTYLLTDYLVSTFHRSVVVPLGLDRYPELRSDYFGNYQRAIWLTSRQTPLLAKAARTAANTIGLPLEVKEVGLLGLEQELETLLASVNEKEVVEGNR